MSMEEGKLQIVGICMGVGIIVLLGFFVFFQRKEASWIDSASENLPQARDIEQNKLKIREFSATQDNNSRRIGFEELFLPVVRPLEPAVSYVQGVISGKNTVDDFPLPDTAYMISESSPVLSEVQIFDIIWPLSYRDALTSLQDMMIKDGFISESEKMSLTSDDHIYVALLKIAD